MKKLIIILSIAAFAFSNKSQAQAMFYTSYGTQHLWGMPPEVQWALESNYYNYHMVHTRRFYDRGRLFFDVVLQRNGVFVDIRIDRRGYIFNSAYRNYYPFHNHVCSGYCGFHRDYYMSYRVAYGHPHYYKHNHVYYRPNVVYVKHDHHHYGNNNVNQGRSYRIDRSDNGRVERVNQTPARGARPNIDRSNNGVRDHGTGVGSGNGNGNGNNGNVGNKGPRGNNGVRDHGVGEGRGKGQGKGQGFGNGNGNSGRVYQASNARTSSPARVSAPTARTSSSSRIASSSSSSRVSGSSTSGRSSRSSNSSSSSRSSSGRTVRTR